jgi:hypothetical protein
MTRRRAVAGSLGIAPATAGRAQDGALGVPATAERQQPGRAGSGERAGSLDESGERQRTRQTGDCRAGSGPGWERTRQTGRADSASPGDEDSPRGLCPAGCPPAEVTHGNPPQYPAEVTYRFLHPKSHCPIFHFSLRRTLKQQKHPGCQTWVLLFVESEMGWSEFTRCMRLCHRWIVKFANKLYNKLEV